MKLSKHNLNNDQPKTLSKRDEKKSVNLKWNSTLFFQLSLIISLLIVYSVMQTKFENKKKTAFIPDIDFLEEPPLIIYTLEEPKKVQKKKVVKKQPKIKAKIINKVVEVDNNANSETDITDYNESKAKEKEIPEPPVVVSIGSKPNKTISLLGVEHVPVFPGCEFLSSNIEKRKCMSLKIKKFIEKKFNADRFDYLNLKGEQTISVQFYIDESGNVSNIKARATEKALEKEAIRVVSKLPKMKPGRQGDNVVKVQYMLPIVFRIN